MRQSPETSVQPPSDLETALHRALPQALRGRVKPVDIAKRLAQEMEGRSAEMPTGPYAPNEFAVVLSPVDLESLEPFQASLSAQFAEYLASLAAAAGFRLLGPVSTDFESDEALPPGEFHVESRVVSADSDQRSFEALTREEAGPRASLQVRSGVDAGAGMPICASSITIGRGLLCDLRLTDPAVARRHADMTVESGSYIIHDLGSAAGTFVGSERIGSRPLRNGEVIRVGGTAIEFTLEP